MKMDARGTRIVSLAALALLASALTALRPPAAAGDGEERSGPQAFATPEALAEALIRAAADNDDAALKALAGPESEDLVQPGGDPTVAKSRAEFAANAQVFWKLEDNEDGSKTLVLGDGRWPFPIPLRQGDAGWTFDVPAGREEMLARRIGRNEITAIALCRAYARAQIEYAAADHDGDRVREYAQHVRSTPGTKDGLYWETGEDGEVSPLGPLVEDAREYLQDRQPTDPVGGYYWKILTEQGENAPGGAHSYVINGNMIAGFALVGFPAEYRQTGVMTFLVSHHGDVLEKDLGEGTTEAVAAMKGYDPDDTWLAVED